jgi:N4-gp56 family major capsid protein
MLPKYWDDTLLDNLYPQLYYYQFGEKRRVPQGSGKTFYIPRWKKSTFVGAIGTEGTPIGTCPLSAQYLSGTLAGYAGAYKHSDFIVMTSLSSVIEGSLREISKDIARAIDNRIKLTTSGAGTEIGAASTAAATRKTNTAIVTKDVIRAATVLDDADAFKFPDGHYAGILHPKVAYDLMAIQSAGQELRDWTNINQYTSGVENIYRGEIGRMFGVRFITTSNIQLSKFAHSAMSAGKASGYQNAVISPGAYHVVELDGAMAQTYVKGLGSAGTADAVNQNATVGAKVYFESVANTLDTRMVRIITGTGFAAT